MHKIKWIKNNKWNTTEFHENKTYKIYALCLILIFIHFYYSILNAMKLCCPRNRKKRKEYVNFESMYLGIKIDENTYTNIYLKITTMEFNNCANNIFFSLVVSLLFLRLLLFSSSLNIIIVYLLCQCLFSVIFRFLFLSLL